MSDINWKDGAVCSVNGEQWQTSMDERLQGDVFHACCSDLSILLDGVNFQLNEIREGDFIQVSELDTEQKYNDVVEVFGLFGFKPCSSHSKYIGMVNYWKGVEIYNGEVANTSSTDGRQLTHSQVTAIGKLKRMMLEREKSKLIENASMMKQLRNSELDAPVKFEINYEVNPFSRYSKENFPKIDLKEKPKRRNKSKQAYDILKSLDYEYDLVKQRWYKKEYI